jgi:hypothetical protein
MYVQISLTTPTNFLAGVFVKFSIQFAARRRTMKVNRGQLEAINKQYKAHHRTAIGFVESVCAIRFVVTDERRRNAIATVPASNLIRLTVGLV